MGFFYGARCKEKELVPVPLLQSVRDNVTRSLDDVNYLHWIPSSAYVGAYGIVLKVEELSLSILVVARARIRIVTLCFSCQKTTVKFWMTNEVLQNFNPPISFRGDLLVVRMTDCSTVGHMRTEDGDHVDNLLSTYVPLCFLMLPDLRLTSSSAIHRQWIK